RPGEPARPWPCRRASGYRTEACPCVRRNVPCRSCNTTGVVAVCHSGHRRSSYPDPVGRSRGSRGSDSRSGSGRPSQASSGKGRKQPVIITGSYCRTTASVIQYSGDTTPSKPQSGRNPEFFLELRVQLELGPQPVHEGDRVAVDAGDKHLTGFVQLLHAGVAAATADLLPHPVPEPFDRVEVRTVAGQVD